MKNEESTCRPTLHAITRVVAAGLLAIAAQIPLAAAQSSAPLLQKTDLAYQGAFHVPRGSDDLETFSYGGNALAFNPVSSSLILTGHSHHQRSAEISIPALVNSSVMDDLNTATLLQPFTDATEGKLDLINPNDSNDQRVGGHLVHGGKLYVSAFSYYDANGTQSGSHFVRPLSLTTTGQVQGPFKVGDDAHFTSAYMAPVPPEWQASLGGPALTGNCCRSIISNQSYGPAIAVFDPDELGPVVNVSATQLILYTSDNPLGGGVSTQNPYFNLTTRIDGVVFPNGTRSVLFFGQHGIGPYCYGTGAECNDPARSEKGVHAYPYVYQVWAYDANELVEVKNGTKSATGLLPYSVWTINVPFETDNHHDTGGAAYDAASQSIYFAQSKVTSDRRPIIHVFEVNSGPKPLSPNNLDVN